MTIYCTDCQGELDSAYFDTRCRDCSHSAYVHVIAHDDIDGHCREGAPERHYDHLLGPGKWIPCECGEWQQKVLRCETCEARARNQDSYDNLTPWQQWNR